MKADAFGEMDGMVAADGGKKSATTATSVVMDGDTSRVPDAPVGGDSGKENRDPSVENETVMDAVSSAKQGQCGALGQDAEHSSIAQDIKPCYQEQLNSASSNAFVEDFPSYSSKNGVDRRKDFSRLTRTSHNLLDPGPSCERPELSEADKAVASIINSENVTETAESSKLELGETLEDDAAYRAEVNKAVESIWGNEDSQEQPPPPRTSTHTEDQDTCSDDAFPQVRSDVPAREVNYEGDSNSEPASRSDSPNLDEDKPDTEMAEKRDDNDSYIDSKLNESVTNLPEPTICNLHTVVSPIKAKIQAAIKTDPVVMTRSTSMMKPSYAASVIPQTNTICAPTVNVMHAPLASVTNLSPTVVMQPSPSYGTLSQPLVSMSQNPLSPPVMNNLSQTSTTLQFPVTSITPSSSSVAQTFESLGQTLTLPVTSWSSCQGLTHGTQTFPILNQSLLQSNFSQTQTIPMPQQQTSPNLIISQSTQKSLLQSSMTVLSDLPTSLNLPISTTLAAVPISSPISMPASSSLNLQHSTPLSLPISSSMALPLSSTLTSNLSINHQLPLVLPVLSTIPVVSPVTNCIPVSLPVSSPIVTNLPVYSQIPYIASGMSALVSLPGMQGLHPSTISLGQQLQQILPVGAAATITNQQSLPYLPPTTSPVKPLIPIASKSCAPPKISPNIQLPKHAKGSSKSKSCSKSNTVAISKSATTKPTSKSTTSKPYAKATTTKSSRSTKPSSRSHSRVAKTALPYSMPVSTIQSILPPNTSHMPSSLPQLLPASNAAQTIALSSVQYQTTGTSCLSQLNAMSTLSSLQGNQSAPVFINQSSTLYAMNTTSDIPTIQLDSTSSFTVLSTSNNIIRQERPNISASGSNSLTYQCEMPKTLSPVSQCYSTAANILPTSTISVNKTNLQTLNSKNVQSMGLQELEKLSHSSMKPSQSNGHNGMHSGINNKNSHVNIPAMSESNMTSVSSETLASEQSLSFDTLACSQANTQMSSFIPNEHQFSNNSYNSAVIHPAISINSSNIIPIDLPQSTSHVSQINVPTANGDENNSIQSEQNTSLPLCEPSYIREQIDLQSDIRSYDQSKSICSESNNDECCTNSQFHALLNGDMNKADIGKLQTNCSDLTTICPNSIACTNDINTDNILNGPQDVLNQEALRTARHGEQACVSNKTESDKTQIRQNEIINITKGLASGKPCLNNDNNNSLFPSNLTAIECNRNNLDSSDPITNLSSPVPNSPNSNSSKSVLSSRPGSVASSTPDTPAVTFSPNQSPVPLPQKNISPPATLNSLPSPKSSTNDTDHQSVNNSVSSVEDPIKCASHVESTISLTAHEPIMEESMSKPQNIDEIERRIQDADPRNMGDDTDAKENRNSFGSLSHNILEHKTSQNVSHSSTSSPSVNTHVSSCSIGSNSSVDQYFSDSPHLHSKSVQSKISSSSPTLECLETVTDASSTITSVSPVSTNSESPNLVSTNSPLTAPSTMSILSPVTLPSSLSVPSPLQHSCVTTHYTPVSPSSLTSLPGSPSTELTLLQPRSEHNSVSVGLDSALSVGLNTLLQKHDEDNSHPSMYSHPAYDHHSKYDAYHAHMYKSNMCSENKSVHQNESVKHLDVMQSMGHQEIDGPLNNNLGSCTMKSSNGTVSSAGMNQQEPPNPTPPHQSDVSSMGVYTPDSTTNSVHSMQGYSQGEFDVSQLGIESPTSISSSEMAHSVEPPQQSTTPQNFPDCAQQMQHQLQQQQQQLSQQHQHSQQQPHQQQATAPSSPHHNSNVSCGNLQMQQQTHSASIQSQSQSSHRSTHDNSMPHLGIGSASQSILLPAQPSIHTSQAVTNSRSHTQTSSVGQSTATSQHTTTTSTSSTRSRSSKQKQRHIQPKPTSSSSRGSNQYSAAQAASVATTTQAQMMHRVAPSPHPLQHSAPHPSHLARASHTPHPSHTAHPSAAAQMQNFTHYQNYMMGYSPMGYPSHAYQAHHTGYPVAPPPASHHRHPSAAAHPGAPNYHFLNSSPPASSPTNPNHMASHPHPSGTPHPPSHPSNVHGAGHPSGQQQQGGASSACLAHLQQLTNGIPEMVLPASQTPGQHHLQLQQCGAPTPPASHSTVTPPPTSHASTHAHNSVLSQQQGPTVSASLTSPHSTITPPLNFPTQQPSTSLSSSVAYKPYKHHHQGVVPGSHPAPPPSHPSHPHHQMSPNMMTSAVLGYQMNGYRMPGQGHPSMSALNNPYIGGPSLNPGLNPSFINNQLPMQMMHHHHLPGQYQDAARQSYHSSYAPMGASNLMHQLNSSMRR